MPELLRLSSQTIDMLSGKITEMYSECGASRKDTLRARILLEETLIKYQNHFNEDIELYYRRYRIFGQNRFIIRIKSPSFDPFTLEENPMAFMIESVMSSFENILPSWKYNNLENEIVFTIQKKTKVNGIVRIGIAFSVSVIFSLLARVLIEKDSLVCFVKSYLDPLSDAYAGMFCIMAVLLTFFAISLSIVRIGDMNAAGITGGKILKRFYLMSLMLVVVLSAPVLPVFQYGAAGHFSIAAKSVYDVLIGFIPSNIVSPFLNFNSTHIMIIGAMFGFSLLAMGQKGTTTVKLFNECNLVSITANNFLNKFINIYIAFKIFSLITTSDFSELQGAGKLVAVIIVSEIVLFVFYTLYVCLKNKISAKVYFHHMLPPFVICLSSANFGASFPSVVDGLLGLDAYDENSTIALNLGSVVFRPACTLVFFFSSIFMASFYNVQISVVWVITAILLSLILVAAVPNIPGVSVSVITLLFAQLGLPSEAVAMMIAINAPLQFLTVAVDTWCLAAECVNISHKHNQ